MKKIVNDNNNNKIVIYTSDTPIINDAQSMLDFMATIDYEDESYRIVLNKESFDEIFFDLSTKIAGDILQKVINYGRKIAIVGDFSVYDSKALRDFIYECNNGKSIFFVETEDEGVKKLSN